MENIDNDDIKQIISNMQKLKDIAMKDLAELLQDSKVGYLKMFNVLKNLNNKLKIEYRAQFNRDLDDDLKKLKEHMNMDMPDMFDLIKNLKNNPNND